MQTSSPLSRISRRSLAVLVPALLLLVSALAAPAGWSTFKGAFFEIGVPPGFKATGVQANPGHSFDSASLWNATSAVEFYVFSPQWNGQAGALSVAQGEVLKGRQASREGKVAVIELTIEARDHSYTRYVVSRTNETENTNKTFGIRVPNEATYKQVRPLYLQWKQTLRQFAD